MRVSFPDVFAVVVAAGPFVYTSKAFVDACLRTKTHYLDITGEYEVFEAIMARHQEAVDAGVALLPGVGMDVVPTDCLASRLKTALPTATHLQMALLPVGGSVSPGTMKTMVLGIIGGTAVRRNGVIASSSNTRTLDWDNPKLGHVHTAPLVWGDISTAFRSTNIPNIGMYIMVPPGASSLTDSWTGATLKWIASWAAGRWVLNKLIERYVAGPSAQQNAEGRVHFSGIAWDANTKRIAESSLTTVEGYRLTALSMIAATHKLETTHKTLSGALTPSLAFGTEYVMEFEHSEWGPLTVRDAVEGEVEARVI